MSLISHLSMCNVYATHTLFVMLHPSNDSSWNFLCRSIICLIAVVNSAIFHRSVGECNVESAIKIQVARAWSGGLRECVLCVQYVCDRRTTCCCVCVAAANIVCVSARTRPFAGMVQTNKRAERTASASLGFRRWEGGSVDSLSWGGRHRSNRVTMLLLHAARSLGFKTWHRRELSTIVDIFCCSSTLFVFVRLFCTTLGRLQDKMTERENKTHVSLVRFYNYFNRSKTFCRVSSVFSRHSTLFLQNNLHIFWVVCAKPQNKAAWYGGALERGTL